MGETHVVQGVVVQGVVVGFDEARGLGEVEGSDGRRLPFHCVQIGDGSRRIAVGAAVGYSVRAGLGGRWEASGIIRR